MSRVFISYSIEDRNLHLLTLLLEQLKNNYDVSVSNLWIDSGIKIASSDIFIGIVTNKSNGVLDHVVIEWQIARKNNIPYVLIIEEGVNVDEPSDINFIRFNRGNPQIAINQLFELNKHTLSTESKKNEYLD